MNRVYLEVLKSADWALFGVLKVVELEVVELNIFYFMIFVNYIDLVNCRPLDYFLYLLSYEVYKIAGLSGDGCFFDSL